MTNGWIFWFGMVVSAVALAGPANPLVSPPPPIQVGKEKAPEGGPKSVGTTVQAPGAAALQAAQAAQEPPDLPLRGNPLPPEKWLASATVTAIVGNRAALNVPTSLNMAQADRKSEIAQPQPLIFGGAPAGSGQAGSSQQSGASDAPPTAKQYARPEILYVRTGKPLFFRGERFEVSVDANEVMIYRPQKKGQEREIVFVGAVSPTEYALAPVAGSYGKPNPSALMRSPQVFGGVYPIPGGGSAAAGNASGGTK